MNCFRSPLITIQLSPLILPSLLLIGLHSMVVRATAPVWLHLTTFTQCRDFSPAGVIPKTGALGCVFSHSSP